jgi:predicted O-methyltransferase YrrM
MLHELKKSLANRIGLKKQYSIEEIFSIMDKWVQQHPWAKAGWVPEDRITPDYTALLPGKELCDISTPFAIQQVRSEIFGLVEAVKALDRKDKMVEIGMGIVGGTHALWTHIFPKIVTIELDPNRIDTFLREQRPNPKQSVLIAGDSTRPYTTQIAKHLADGCDFLFIDGDHTRYGVETDWRNYEPLVRNGGIIAFHDTVLDSPPQIEVRSFVDELESGKITGSPVKMHHLRKSLCVGISFYYKNSSPGQ